MTSTIPTFQFQFDSPEATSRFAQSLAPLLTAGDVILLHGSVGAGKTHFARSLIQSRLEQPEDVPSPTFTIVQTYDLGGVDLWHCDLYRLTSPDEAIELGLEDAFETAICLVEWPDRLAELAPDDALNIQFSTESVLERRHAKLWSTATKWAPILERLSG